MRGNWLWAALVAGVVVVLAYAWIDAGREPVHQIVVDVPVPGQGR